MSQFWPRNLETQWVKLPHNLLDVLSVGPDSHFRKIPDR